MLSQEARASRLSFTDVIKRLAEQEPTEATFVSKRVGLCVLCGVGGDVGR